MIAAIHTTNVPRHHRARSDEPVRWAGIAIDAASAAALYSRRQTERARQAEKGSRSSGRGGDESSSEWHHNAKRESEGASGWGTDSTRRCSGKRSVEVIGGCLFSSFRPCSVNNRYCRTESRIRYSSVAPVKGCVRKLLWLPSMFTQVCCLSDRMYNRKF